MEQSKPSIQDENRSVKDYQTPLSRRKRFYDKSDSEGWYLETIDGGLKMPNRICAATDFFLKTDYFFVSREGEFFKSVQFQINNDGKWFSLSFNNGKIWENYQFFESRIKNAEYLDVDNTLKDINEQLKNLFNNFTIKI